VLFDKDALEAAFGEIGQRALAAGRLVIWRSMEARRSC
jgi:hypothetical protein